MNRYSNKSLSQLIKIAQRHFNKYIRERDKDKPCINCGNFRTLQAGHLYPTSSHSKLRFDEDNVNGECLQCNKYEAHSHAFRYVPNLKRRIGEERFKKLEIRAGMVKRNNDLWDRFTLISIIEKYKKIKELNTK